MNLSEADFDWLMEINFHAVVRMTRAFLPVLRASDDARIVNVSSVFGLIAPPGQCAYCAACRRRQPARSSCEALRSAVPAFSLAGMRFSSRSSSACSP